MSNGITCPRCGNTPSQWQLDSTEPLLCSECRKALPTYQVPPPAWAPSMPSPPASPPPPPPPPPRPPAGDYAGLWVRAFALVVDALLLLGVTYVCVWLPVTLVGGEAGQPGAFTFPPTVYMILALLYLTVMESSRRSATLGKRLFRLTVTDMAGGRISFARAFVRNVVKVASFLFPPIFALSGFTARKRGLHDYASGTAVVRGAPAPELDGPRPRLRRPAVVALGAAAVVVIVLLVKREHDAAYTRLCADVLSATAHDAGLRVHDGPGIWPPSPGPIEAVPPYGAPFGAYAVFPTAENAPSGRAPSRYRWGRDGPFLAYNARLAEFPEGVRSKGIPRMDMLVVMAESSSPSIRDTDDVVYPHRGRCWVLTADGRLRQRSRDEVAAMRFRHRDDLWEGGGGPIVGLAHMPTDPDKAGAAWELARPRGSNPAAPLSNRNQERVALQCQWLSLRPSAATPMQVQGQFKGRLPHLGNIRQALGIAPERAPHFADSTGKPCEKRSRRIFFQNVGSFPRVDCILDEDGVTVTRFFADTAGERHATDCIASDEWHCDKAVQLWTEQIAGLGSSSVAADREAIQGAERIGYLSDGSCKKNRDDYWRDIGGGLRGYGEGRRYEQGDSRFHGDPETCDIIVVLADYKRTRQSRVPYYSFGVSYAGSITYYRNSVTLAVLDAHNPPNVLFRRRLTARPKRAGSDIERSFSWSGEDRDASSELRAKVEATCKSLGLGE